MSYLAPISTVRPRGLCNLWAVVSDWDKEKTYFINIDCFSLHLANVICVADYISIILWVMPGKNGLSTVLSGVWVLFFQKSL